jgi:hypothetical protein
VPTSRTPLPPAPAPRAAPARRLGRARAGNFFSAAFENNCLAVAGASGGIFGMIGLYLADMILNFQSIKRRGPAGAPAHARGRVARPCMQAHAAWWARRPSSAGCTYTASETACQPRACQGP